MADALLVIMRWVHISSVAALIGGSLYGWIAAAGALGTLDEAGRKALGDEMAARYKPVVVAAITLLVVSGIFNLVSNPGHSLRYHILLGVKLLLVLHVFAVMLLSTQPGRERRGRMMAGAAISGLAIIAISAYLRRIM